MVRPPPQIDALRRYRQYRPSPGPTVLGKIIEQVAANPSIPLDRLEALLRAARRLIVDGARASFAADMARLQQDLIALGNGEQDFGQLQITPGWHRLVDNAISALTRHGFAMTFHVTREMRHVVVTAILSHADGQSLLSSLHVPVQADEPDVLRRSIATLLASLTTPHFAKWNWDGDWSN